MDAINTTVACCIFCRAGVNAHQMSVINIGVFRVQKRVNICIRPTACAQINAQIVTV